MNRNFRELPPLSLYIHLPWCVAKCPYCDFNSHEQGDVLPETQYVDAVLADLSQEMPQVWGRTLTSVFIGGGTPSLFSADAIEQLLSGVRALAGLPPDIEVTMEANPGTFEQARFDDFRRVGINRLSIGIQSFKQQQLQALGRIHGSDESLGAVDIARQAGFDNINLDLMFGLPQQSIADAMDDIETACGLQPEHISCYQLTLEPNTLFNKFPPQLPLDEDIWSMQQQGAERLREQNYQRYEISAWSRPRRQSVHNSNYWLFGDYIGIGAGAHGKLSFADSGRILRRSKLKHPASYMKAAASQNRISQEHVVSLEDTALEFMMNALRLTDGFSPNLYHTHTGTELASCQQYLNSAIDAGLLEQSVMAIKPTEKGLDFLNDLLQHFMPSDEPEVTRDNSSVRLSYPLIPIKSQ